VRVQQSNFIASKAVRRKYNNSFYEFCILAFQSNKKTSWSCNYFGVSVTKKFFECFLEKRGLFDFIKIGLHSMIKKFSSPKIKMWFVPMFLTGSLAVFRFVAKPHFQNFAGGFFAAAGGEMRSNYFKNIAPERKTL